MDKKNVVVLSVSAGAGHVRAAQALCAAADREYPDLGLTHVDVMELVPPGFRSVYADSYIKLVEKAPLLWAFLYQATDRRKRNSRLHGLRRGIERLNTRGLDRELQRLAPDAILCTHFLPAELLSRRIGKRRATPPVWVQITDFDVHGLWIHPHIQGYFVANDEIAARVVARGIEPERVYVTGIPIMPQFATAPERATAAAGLGLDPARPTVLMMSGGAGVGGIDVLAERLTQCLPPTVQIVVLAGRNEKMLARLRKLAARSDGRLFPMGFTTTIERVMAAADVAITKPGGLTTSECLAIRLPMIVVSPIPGQEERNADFLLECGAALKAVDAAALEFKLQRLLAEPVRLQVMRERMREQAQPDAARQVLAVIRAAL